MHQDRNNTPMRQANSIQLSTPCTVAQDQLVDLSKGSYCRTCEKQVVDYTNMNDRELIQALRQNHTGCGSFRKNQLDRPLIENELVRRGYSLAAIALLFAIQLCSLEISGQSTNSNTHVGITSIISTKLNKDLIDDHKDLSFREISVIDDQGYPLSYATIAVINLDSVIIDGEVTDSTGTSLLKLNDQANSIRVSYIGYQHKEIRIEELEDNVIELRSLSSQLPEVMVTSDKVDVTRTVAGMFGYSFQGEEDRNKDIPDESKAIDLKLFPNPSSGYCTLESKLLKEALLINVYTSVGQLVLSIPVAHKVKTTIPIQLISPYTSGTYIVELILNNNSTEVVKWVVK